MTILISALNDIAIPWADTMWRACWQGSIIVLLIWILCTVFPHLSPSAKCWFWRLACAKLLLGLVVPPVTLRLGFGSAIDAVEGLEFVVEHGRYAVDGVSRLLSVMPERLTRSVSQPSVTQNIAIGSETGIHLFRSSISITTLVMIIWLLLVAVLLFKTIREWNRMRRIKNKCLTEGEPFYDTKVADNSKRPAIVVADAVSQTLLMGIRRPFIVLPRAIANMDPPDIEVILRHEMAHVKRRDLLWNWLPAITCILIPLTPASWVANRELMLAQESACDRESLSGSGVSPAQYARLLVQLLTLHDEGSGLPTGTVAMSGAHRWMKRRLLELGRCPVMPKKLTVMATVALSLLVLTLVPWQMETTDSAKAANFQPATAQNTGYGETVTIGSKSGLILGKSTSDDIRRVMGSPDRYFDIASDKIVMSGSNLEQYSMLYCKDNIRFHIIDDTLIGLEAQAPTYTFRGITVGSSSEALYELIGKPQSVANIYRNANSDGDGREGVSNREPVEYRLHDPQSGDALGYPIPEMNAFIIVKQGKVWSIVRDIAMDYGSK